VSYLYGERIPAITPERMALFAKLNTMEASGYKTNDQTRMDLATWRCSIKETLERVIEKNKYSVR
jgi:hypothetical protein